MQSQHEVFLHTFQKGFVIHDTIALFLHKDVSNQQNELLIEINSSGEIYARVAYPNLQLENILVELGYSYYLRTRKKIFRLSYEMLNKYPQRFIFTNLSFQEYNQRGKSVLNWNYSISALQMNPINGFSSKYQEVCRSIFDIIVFVLGDVISKVSFLTKNKNFELEFYYNNIETFQVIQGLMSEFDVIMIDNERALLSIPSHEIDDIIYEDRP